MNIANNEKDKFVKRAVKIASVEKPNMDFTSAVMDKIGQLNMATSAPINANPLISRKGWITISALIIAIFSILLSLGPTTIQPEFLFDYSEYFRTIEFSVPFTVSKIFLIGLFAFIFFFIIEITLLTKKLNRIK